METKKPKKDINNILKKVASKIKTANIYTGDDADNIDFIPTGNVVVDYILGGGLPSGRTIEVFGQESSGKTTLTMCWIAQLQKLGYICALIDAERALEPKYVEKLGVDLSSLIVHEPLHGEEAFKVIRELINTGEIRLIVVDSVAALVPKKMLDGNIGDSHVALQARMMSQALSMITSELKNTKTTLVFLNQLRDNVGVMFGEQHTTPGGRALKFYASVRLQMKRISRLTDKHNRVVGTETEIYCKKNKVSYPYRKGTVEILYNSGISKFSGLFSLALKLGIVKKVSSKTYSFGGVEFTKAKFEEVVLNKKELYKKLLEGMEE